MASTPEQRRASRARRKARLLGTVNVLKDKPCADCQGRFPVVCMDFDHVHGGKLMDVSRMILHDYPMAKILAEIELCDLVCANCHRIRSQRRWAATMSATPLVPGVVRATQTHCTREHQLVSPNLRNCADGRRRCLACSKGHRRAASAARRGIRLDLRAEADTVYLEIMSAA